MPFHPTLIPGVIRPGGGFGGNGNGGGFGGSGGLPPVPPIDFRALPRVRDLRIRLLGSRKVEITWNTVPSDMLGSAAVYSVRLTPETLVGSSAGDASWTRRCYDLSKEIDQRDYTRTNTYKVVFDGSDSPDGWVMVSTIWNGETLEYSNPVRCQFSITTGLVPPGITGQIFAIQAKSYPYRGFYINSLQMAFAWMAPSDASNFNGVALHVTGINGLTTPVELSAFQTWDQTRQTFTPIINLPLESGRVNGVATFTNGSPNIVRVSGTTYIAGDVGHRVVVFDPTTGAVIDTGLNNVATYTDANHITQSANFTGTSSNYLYRILNPMTAYFVSVSKSGVRTPLYTSAPNASV